VGQCSSGECGQQAIDRVKAIMYNISNSIVGTVLENKSSHLHLLGMIPYILNIACLHINNFPDRI
jgi:hypothetical protein